MNRPYKRYPVNSLPAQTCRAGLMWQGNLCRLAGVLLFSGVTMLAGCHRAPTAAEKAFQQGKEAATNREFDVAIASFTEAIRLDPNSAMAYRDRGLAYEGKGDHDKALADYTEALRINPQYDQAYYLRGAIYESKGEQDNAFADFTEAIRCNPQYHEAYFLRGAIYESRGDQNKAIEDYTEAIRSNPGFTRHTSDAVTPIGKVATTAGRRQTWRSLARTDCH